MPTPDQQAFIEKAAAHFHANNPGASDEEIAGMVKQAYSIKFGSTQTEQPAQDSTPPTTARAAITVQKGLEQLPPETPAEVKAAINQRGFQPENKQKIRAGLNPAIEDYKDVKRSARKLIASGGPTLGDEVIDTLKAAANTTPGRYALTGIEALNKGLTTAGNLVRYGLEPTTVPSTEPSLSGPLDYIKAAYAGDIGDPADFAAKNAIAREQPLKPGNLAGHIYGAIGNVATAVTPQVYEKATGPIEDAQGRYEESNAAARDFAKSLSEGIASDPLMLASFGLKGASQTIGPQALEALKLSGVTGANAERAAALAQKIITTNQGPAVAKNLGRVMKAAGASEKAVSQVFGPKFTFAGRSGLAYAGQDLSKATRALGLGKLGVPEQWLRRATEPIGDAARTVLGRPQGSYHERVFKAGELAKMRHGSANEIAEVFADYNENVAPFMPADKARRQAIVKYMDAPPPFLPDGAPNPEFTKVRDAMMTSTGYGGAPTIAAADSKAIEKLTEFFDRVGSKYQQAGLIDKVESGYVPRLWREDKKGVGAFIRRHIIEDEHPMVSSRHERAGIEHQRPLGAEFPGNKAPLDPHQIVSEYVGPMERAAAQKRLDDTMKAFYRGKVPPDVQKLAAKAFSGVRIKLVDGLLNLFKSQQLFPRGSFAVANTFEEGAKSISAGLIGHGDDIPTAKKIFDANIPDSAVILETPARSYTAGELRNEIKSRGFSQSSITKDFNNPSSAVRQFNETSDKAAGIGAVSRYGRRAKEQPLSTAAQAFQDVTNLGVNRLGKRYAENLDSTLKTAGFIGRLRQGDSVDQAAQRVLQVHFDYSDASPALKAAKRVFPFAGFTANTAEHLPGVIARNPALAVAQSYGVQQAQPNDFADQAPQYQRSAGQTVPLGEGSRSAIHAVVNAAGGKTDPAYGLSYRPRGLLTEGLSQPAAAVTGSPEDLALLAGPLAQPVIEAISGKDFLTKKEQGPLSLQTGTFPLVPAGNNYLPPELQANEGNVALSKYLAPWLGPYAPILANFAAADKAVTPPFASAPMNGDPIQKLLFQLSGSLGFPIAQTTPATGFVDQMQREAPKAAAEVGKQLKKDTKARRKK